MGIYVGAVGANIYLYIKNKNIVNDSIPFYMLCWSLQFALTQRVISWRFCVLFMGSRAAQSCFQIWNLSAVLLSRCSGPVLDSLEKMQYK